MSNYLLRTITKDAQVNGDDGNIIYVRATRMRDSIGHAEIKIAFGDKSISFDIGEDYETHAIMVANMLLNIADNPCLLPTIEE